MRKGCRALRDGWDCQARGQGERNGVTVADTLARLWGEESAGASGGPGVALSGFVALVIVWMFSMGKGLRVKDGCSLAEESFPTQTTVCGWW